ncbi:carboxypeptidase-like regulatory domain-containing protein [Pedobacter sp. NJ-S-72]
MKKIHLLLVVLLSAFSFTSAFAADIAEFKGKIIDAQTKLPLPGASITIPDLRTSAITNQNGEFTFKNAPAHGRFLFRSAI